MRTTIKGNIKLIRHFSFKSIFLKYWLKLSLFTVLPFSCLTLFLFSSYRNATISRLSSDLYETTSVNQSAILRQLEISDEFFSKLADNASLALYLSSSEQGSDYARRIPSIIEQALIEEPTLHSIHIYSFLHSYVFSTLGGHSIEDFEHNDWLKYYNSTNKTNFTQKSYIYNYLSKMNEDVLTICYGYSSGSHCYGLVVVNFSFDALNEVLPLNSRDLLFLLDTKDNVLFSNCNSLIGQNLNEHYEYITAEKTIQTNVSENYISASCILENTPYKLVIIAQSDSYTEHIISSKYLLIFALLVAIFLPLILSFYLSMSFYRSITEIINSFSLVAPIDDISEYENEINFITKQLNDISDRSKQIENTLSNKMALLKKTQFSVMQLQFNQHFLFNTLNLIALMIRSETQGKSNSLNAVFLLSSLLRASLDTNQYIVPVQTEIMYTKKYIEIEQLKYKNGVDINWDIDDEIYNYKTLKLILQPIIENAFTHGLKPLTDNRTKKLTIRGRISENTIIFNVIDNGVGFSNETLQSIKNSFDNSSTHSVNHVGLSNVNTRINLIFGENFGVNIFSDNNGSNVQITLPKIDEF